MGGSGESISLSRRKTNSDSEKNDDCCNQENNLKTTKQVNHTSLKKPHCYHIRGTKLERTGPWRFPQGSKMFSVQDVPQRGTQGALPGACPRAWGRGGIPGLTSPPNSNYPADGILCEGLGATIQSDHPWTGSGSTDATPRAPIKVGAISRPSNPP